MDTAPAIVTDKLCKRYGDAKTFALQNLSLSVAAGEVYGFLGANGAGKSTTIRLLMNFLNPTSGTATICGLDSVSSSVPLKQFIGYLAGEIALYNKMTGRELVSALGQLQRVDPTYLQTLVDRFEVELDKPIGKLSKGNRQKVGILQAFMHQPKVLILDEPTSGLDPLMQEEFYKLVREVSAAGSAIFVSSHNLSEVQRMCDRVGIIRGGRLIMEKSVDEMTSSVSQQFVVTFSGKVPDSLQHVKGVSISAQTDTTATIDTTDLQALFAFLAKHKVTALKTLQIDLEEEFLHYYDEETT